MVVLPQNVPPPEPVTVPGAAFTVITVVDKQPADVVYATVAVPLLRPVNTPAVLIVPTAGVLLLHVPPASALLRDRVEPEHTLPPPVTGREGLTVATIVELQPVLAVYVMDAVPPAIPVTRPLVGFTVATPMAPLDHVPPDGALLSVVVAPWHIAADPDTGDIACTFTLIIRKHPVGRV
jgi:hypothetical protein